MTTFEFLLAAPNGPFFVALAVTLLLAAIQVIDAVAGLGLFDMVDDLLPDADLDGADGGLFADGLSWLNVGKVPVLVLLLIFLTAFTLIGYGAQSVTRGITGFMWPALLAGPAAAVAAVPVTRTLSRLLARVVPREETYAVGREALVGRLAEVTLGPVTAETHGKAKVSDSYGNSHYVRVRASAPDGRFETGATVLLVGHDGGLFDAITPPASLAG